MFPRVCYKLHVGKEARGVEEIHLFTMMMGYYSMAFSHLTNWLLTNKSASSYHFPFLSSIFFFPPPLEKTYSTKCFFCNVPLDSITVSFAYIEVKPYFIDCLTSETFYKRYLSNQLYLMQISFFNITTISRVIRDEQLSEWMNRWMNESIKLRYFSQGVYNRDRHRHKYFSLFTLWSVHRYFLGHTPKVMKWAIISNPVRKNAKLHIC